MLYITSYPIERLLNRKNLLNMTKGFLKKRRIASPLLRWVAV
ncbi:hypothetical protein PRUB_a4636 [Pseudoalteromonas rubra]|uniref:Uncharacterized protein n=1 Tax=Pseudoalteromonas rubra TaxID=43658 RepID=A0A8T0CBU7_9GAMM|nr:hypothetical protein PRUB_a4636 [Pseudoalteromonas rubra]